MKKSFICGLTLLLAAGVSLQAAPADEIKAAAKKLSEQENYTWVSEADGGRFTSTTTGKTDKSGVIVLETSRGDNTFNAVIKGEKAAFEGQDGWVAIEGDDQGQGRGRFMARTLRNTRTPAEDAQRIAGLVKDLKKEGDVYSGALTPEGVGELMRFGRRAGGEPPAGASGMAKFWVRDGILTKYEYQVKGTVSFGGNDVDVDRTTTVEIKDIGTTKVNVPEGAKKHIS